VRDSTNRQVRKKRAAGTGRPFLILCLVLCAVAVDTGCKRSSASDTLVIAIELAPRGFDPRFSTSIVPSARVMQLIYDTLVVKNEKFEFAPSLAERFEESNDHLTFTFHLRSGVNFHNGKPLTSRDVKYTFDSLLWPELRSPIRGAVDKIASVDAPDEHTVVFHAREPFYTFVGNLPAIGIIPAGSGPELIDSPIGSGPYRFVSYSEGQPVRLEANPDYWAGAPGIPRVEVKFVPDNSTRQAELMSGEVDLAYNAQFDPETVRALSSRRDIQVRIGDGASVGYLGLNVSGNSPLANQKLRQAIAYGIDREVIIHRLLRDQARPAQAILPPEHWAYEPNVTVYNHDPAMATRLLDEAGFPDPDGDGPEPRLTLTMMTSTTQLSRNIASIMQDQLRRIGIRLELQSLETATLLDRINNAQFDIYYLIGIGFNQLTDVFQFVYHSRYQNPQFNDAIAKLRAATNPAEIEGLFTKLDTILERKDYCPVELPKLLPEDVPVVVRRDYYFRLARILTDRGGQNRMRYCNPLVDNLIEGAESSNDRQTKLELYSRIQKTVADELPQIYLWYPANVLVARSRVGNIQIEPSGSWYFIQRLTKM
jgi:peptide/nickel transport system substrate-binding protein